MNTWQHNVPYNYIDTKLSYVRRYIDKPAAYVDKLGLAQCMGLIKRDIRVSLPPPCITSWSQLHQIQNLTSLINITIKSHKPYKSCKSQKSHKSLTSVTNLTSLTNLTIHTKLTSLTNLPPCIVKILHISQVSHYNCLFVILYMYLVQLALLQSRGWLGKTAKLDSKVQHNVYIHTMRRNSSLICFQ